MCDSRPCLRWVLNPTFVRSFHWIKANDIEQNLPDQNSLLYKSQNFWTCWRLQPLHPLLLAGEWEEPSGGGRVVPKGMAFGRSLSPGVFRPSFKRHPCGFGGFGIVFFWEVSSLIDANLTRNSTHWFRQAKPPPSQLRMVAWLTT